MTKIINVVGMGVCDELNHCEMIMSMLSDAEEAGYKSNYFDFTEHSTDFPKANAWIFIHMEPMPLIKEPNIRILHTDTDDDIISKMQDLADYLDGIKEFSAPVEEQKKDDCPFFGEDPYAPKEVKIQDLGFDIDYDQVVKIPFDYIVINVNGKDVKLTKDNIVTLGKVYNMINFFGYKIQRVVL